MYPYNVQYLVYAADQFHVTLTEEMIDQFMKYYDLLIEWNKKINLTTITEYDDVLRKHFVDSISIVKAMDLSKVNNMIDIGTGAGFPGIPIKIICPEMNIVLLDSLDKRVKFLNTVIDSLGLKNIKAIHGRAEEAARNQDYREHFDLAVSRAVANLSSLSEYCLPFVKKEGFFISYKAEMAESEMIEAQKAMYLLGGKKNNIVNFTLPETDINRSLCIIQKINHTSSKYPRKAGTPTKDPLR